MSGADGLVPVALERGACVVSIDTELAWGEAHRRRGRMGRRSRLAHERRIVARTLAVFERHGIAATWAVVGHLFLDRCAAGPDGRAHPDLARPVYGWLDGEDWFAIDPCTTLDQAPDFYGRDLVEQILDCAVGQEVACHGFSHAMIGQAGCTAEVLDSELTAAARAASELGVTPRSFVYPRNAIGHVDRLAAHGYVAYRGRRVGPTFGTRPAWQRPLLRALDAVRPLAPSVVLPARHPTGIVNVPQTYLFAPATRRRWVPVGTWVRQPIARLRQAARHRGLFHLWLHPHNLTDSPERAVRALDRICAEAARLRESGHLDVLTMGEVAEGLRAGPEASAAAGGATAQAVAS